MHIPVSKPLRIPSVQFGHAGHSGPPQSTPASSPFNAPSWHVAATPCAPPEQHRAFNVMLADWHITKKKT
jgi:hypothetical protein